MIAQESIEPEMLPNAETFLRDSPTIRPLRFTSEQLRSFLTSFEDVPLSADGATLLLNLEQGLENYDWCLSHDAAQAALVEAYDVAKAAAENPETAALYESDVLTLEALSRAQLPSASSLKAIKKPELIERLAPLAEHLNRYEAINRNWMRLSPRKLKPLEESAATTLAQARLSQQAVPAAETVAPALAESAPASSESWVFDSASLAEGSGGGHVHGPDCNHGVMTYRPVSLRTESYIPSDGCSDGCTHSHASSSGGSSYFSLQNSEGRYDAGAASELEQKTASVAERFEQWMQRQKPSHLIVAASLSALAVGLLYVSGKREQEREQSKRQKKHSDSARNADSAPLGISLS